MMTGLLGRWKRILDAKHLYESLLALEAFHGRRRLVSKSVGSNKRVITSLHGILKPFLLRRLKSDVENNLPPKKEYVLYAPLTKSQVDLYDVSIFFQWAFEDIP